VEALMATSKTPAPRQDQAKQRNAPAAHSFWKDDLPFIRNALIVLVVSLVSSAALVGVSVVVVEKQQAEKKQLQMQLKTLRGKYAQIKNEKQEIEEFQPRFLQLRKQGFVGEEKRLDWAEHIRRVQEHRKLAPLTYEVAAQQPFMVDPSVPAGDFELRGSKMQLHMQLLHEMDLFNFLDDLKGVVPYTVQACTIGATKTAQINALSPRFDAECTLYWVTLGERANPAETAKAAAP
jgi:hypothetical protein